METFNLSTQSREAHGSALCTWCSASVDYQQFRKTRWWPHPGILTQAIQGALQVHLPSTVPCDTDATCPAPALPGSWNLASTPSLGSPPPVSSASSCFGYISSSTTALPLQGLRVLHAFSLQPFFHNLPC